MLLKLVLSSQLRELVDREFFSLVIQQEFSAGTGNVFKSDILPKRTFEMRAVEI